MSPTRKSMRPSPPRGQALAGELDERRRQVDGHHVGAALRGLHGEGAGAAAGVEEALAAEVRGSQLEQQVRISSRPRAHGLRGCG
jgi:hypothetical protein